MTADIRIKETALECSGDLFRRSPHAVKAFFVNRRCTHAHAPILYPGENPGATFTIILQTDTARREKIADAARRSVSSTMRHAE